MAGRLRSVSCDASRQHLTLDLLASEEFSCKDISHEAVHSSIDDLSATGVSIKQTLRDMHLEYCLMGKKEVRIERATLAIDCLRTR